MNAIPTSPPTPPAVPTPTIEQYTAYLQDLGNNGTRYTTANGFYLSIITALLGILALTKPGVDLTDLQAILRLAVPLFACLLCWVWFQTVLFYRTLFRTKFRVLREFEQRGGLFPAFERERELIQSGGARWLLENEERIPLLLALPFLIILVYVILKLLKWI
jgi:hypothetical protein